ncbi:MAG: DegT/DnrJ/EryC1/StrS family aminotransferase [Bryobacteraceae bacterium]
MTRRKFAHAAVAAATAASANADSAKPALLGGNPVRKEAFPGWPIVRENDEQAILQTLRKGRWNRLNGDSVARFEETWAKMLGAKYCLGTSSGTTALFTALNALDVGPGDEVLVPPYTFVATINVVLLQHALPVFVDSDIETFQMDARKVDAAITKRTACLLPAHIGGAPVDLDTLLETGRKRKLPVLEDACQAHLGEWRKRKLSTLGDLGCFSFQASKNLNSGEGGAILTDNLDLVERCRSFHNNGRWSNQSAEKYARNGCNLRLTEFQGALLLSQLARVEDQSRVRERNAEYLSGLLRQIPGITPARVYEGCTRNAYHLYMFRYDRQRFENLPRARFLQAMAAEGVRCSGGYKPLNKEAFLRNTLQSKAFRRIYSEKEVAQWHERNHCPVNDRLCEEGVWLTQTMLLGSREDMDQIAEAVRKTQKHAAALLKT